MAISIKQPQRKENNLRFVCESAYLPVRKDANSMKALDEVIKENVLKVNAKAHQCLISILNAYESIHFYTPNCFEIGYASRNILDFDLSDKAAQDKEKVDELVAAGMSRAEAAAEFTGDAAFEEWYDSWYQKINDTAHSKQ